MVVTALSRSKERTMNPELWLAVAACWLGIVLYGAWRWVREDMMFRRHRSREGHNDPARCRFCRQYGPMPANPGRRP